jgi:hypothetical protein
MGRSLGHREVVAAARRLDAATAATAPDGEGAAHQPRIRNSAATHERDPPEGA